MKFIALSGLVITGFLAGYTFQFLTVTNGDMNRDGVLNITDLSILASIINEQG